jgi:hypothetical protein
MREELLREYIRSSLLTEDDGGVGGYGDYGGGGYSSDMSSGMVGPYGIRFGSDQQMYDTFIGPFVDVFKTAVGKSKEVSRKTQTLLWVGLQTVLTTLIPVYGYNYAEVFDKEKEDIEKIRDEYKDVYDRTDQALKSHDAALLAFMASPALTLGYAASKMTAKASKSLLSAASGGLSDKIYDSAKEKAVAAGRWMLGDDDSSSSRSSSKKKSSPKAAASIFDSIGEGQINEEEGDEKKGSEVTPQKILRNKKFIAKAAESPKAKEMQAKATEIYRKTLSEVFKQAEGLLKKARTVEDIEKLVGKKMKPDMKKKLDEIKNLPPQEKVKAEKMLIDGSKKAMKDFYVKNLTQEVDAVLKAGIPEDAQFVKDYRTVISKVKSL